MHAFLIKTDERTIERRKWPHSRDDKDYVAHCKLHGQDPSLQRYYDLLQCDTFTIVTPPGLAGEDAIFVDDEGLIKGPVYQFFGVKGYPQPLAGRGLVLGTDRNGNSASPETTLEWLHQNVYWIERLTQSHWSISSAIAPSKSIVATLSAVEAMLAGDRPQPVSRSG